MPRSGTNLLADTMACHPQVVRSPGQFWEFVPFRFQKELEHYLQAIEATKHADGFSTTDFLPAIGKAWYEFLTQTCDLGGQIPLWKEPSVNHLESMFMQFPNAKVIFVVRDGRDVVQSALKSGFVLPQRDVLNRKHWRRFMPEEDFKILCDMYFKAASKLIRFLSEDTQSAWLKSYRMVRFEDLVCEPQDTIVKLCEHCHLDVEQFDWDAFREMSVRGSSFLRDRQGSVNFSKGVKRPMEFNPIGRWNSWPRSRRRIFANTCGDVMMELGYQL